MPITHEAQFRKLGSSGEGAVIRIGNWMGRHMKVIGGLLGAVALAGLSSSAAAQAPPAGSYRQSCGNIQVQGTTLTAVCRTTDGRQVQTALDIAGCAGDIGNNDGQMQCNGGHPLASPGSGYQQAPGYGYPPPGYQQAPGAGYPPPGYGPSPR